MEEPTADTNTQQINPKGTRRDKGDRKDQQDQYRAPQVLAGPVGGVGLCVHVQDVVKVVEICWRLNVSI